MPQSLRCRRWAEAIAKGTIRVSNWAKMVYHNESYSGWRGPAEICPPPFLRVLKDPRIVQFAEARD